MNPCLYCPRRRDGKTGEWSSEEVELRTLGGNQMNYVSWVNEGSKTGAAHTSKWESCAASDLLVKGVGDSPDMQVLDKCIPPSLHLLLSLNDIIKSLEKIMPDLKEVLYQVIIWVCFHLIKILVCLVYLSLCLCKEINVCISAIWCTST